MAGTAPSASHWYVEGHRRRDRPNAFKGDIAIRLPTITASILLVAAAAPAPAIAQAGSSAPLLQSTTSKIFSGERSRDVLAAQVLLDRAQHSPGTIDGYMGGNTRRAIEAYQRASDLAVTGAIDGKLLDHLRQAHAGELLQTYTITADDADGPFRRVPSSMTGKAELDRVAFETPAELLAEKFHMAESFLKALNPGADFGKAGTRIQVVRAGPEKLGADVARVEVDKGSNELRAFSSDGTLLATYPTTVGSSFHPSPSTSLEVLAVAMDPTYHFDPEGRNWGPDRKLTIAPGPNNPVGAVWIDLSRDGYGIHGTPDPSLIGKTNSHGCVRLTNWDATELAKAVSKGTKVVFL